MNQGMVLVAGRALLSALFLVAGVHKILIWSAQVAYFTRLGFPAPEFFTVVAIVIELGAGLALLVGWKTRWAAWLLALFVLIAAFMAHRFWEFDAQQLANQMNHFLKNLAIIGGLLFVAAFGPGPASVDKR
ncbi:MAG: DoxX family protein [Betaproteobacteria bacterium]